MTTQIKNTAPTTDELKATADRLEKAADKAQAKATKEGATAEHIAAAGKAIARHLAARERYNAQAEAERVEKVAPVIAKIKEEMDREEAAKMEMKPLTADNDGRAQITDDTLEQVRAENPEKVYTVMRFADALETKTAHDRASYCNPIMFISEAQFTEMLEVLPPQKWEHHGAWEAFRMMEYTTGIITGHYLRIGKYFFFANREIGDTVYQTLKTEAEALIRALKACHHLYCSCCGTSTTGRQWWNRDTGHGVCRECYQKIAQKEGESQATNYYGIAGVHHSI